MPTMRGQCPSARWGLPHVMPGQGFAATTARPHRPPPAALIRSARRDYGAGPTSQGPRPLASTPRPPRARPNGQGSGGFILLPPQCRRSGHAAGQTPRAPTSGAGLALTFTPVGPAASPGWGHLVWLRYSETPKFPRPGETEAGGWRCTEPTVQGRERLDFVPAAGSPSPLHIPVLKTGCEARPTARSHGMARHGGAGAGRQPSVAGGEPARRSHIREGGSPFPGIFQAPSGPGSGGRSLAALAQLPWLGAAVAPGRGWHRRCPAGTSWVLALLPAVLLAVRHNGGP